MLLFGPAENPVSFVTKYGDGSMDSDIILICASFSPPTKGINHLHSSGFGMCQPVGQTFRGSETTYQLYLLSNSGLTVSSRHAGVVSCDHCSSSITFGISSPLENFEVRRPSKGSFAQLFSFS